MEDLSLGVWLGDYKVWGSRVSLVSLFGGKRNCIEAFDGMDFFFFSRLAVMRDDKERLFLLMSGRKS